jgi:ketosteroid isomerase-like protein
MRTGKGLSPADVVTTSTQAINERDTEALRRLTRRDFVAFPASPFLGGDGRPYSGRDGLARWLEDLGARWSQFSMAVDEVRERGDRVYCRALMTVRPKRVDSPVSHEMYLVLNTRRGQLAGVRSYGSDRQAALSAWSGSRGC